MALKKPSADSVIEVKRDLVAFANELVPETFIPASLLLNYSSVTKRLGVSAISMLPSILAITATAMGKAKVEINANWKSDVAVYCVLIANKGSGKTALFKYFKKCLSAIEEKRMEESSPPKKRRSSDNTDKEKEGLLSKQIILETATKEGLFQLLDQNGGVACLLSDEYQTVLESMKNYGGDGVEFMSRFIQLHDADDIRINTKGSGLLFIKEPHLNIAACTQISTLLTWMSTMKDTQGYWDRHLLIFSPDVYSTFAEKLAASTENGVDFTEVLQVIFSSHEDSQTYRVADNAQYLIERHHDTLQADREKLQFEEDGDDLCGQRAKMFGLILRVAAIYQALTNAFRTLGTPEGPEPSQDYHSCASGSSGTPPPPGDESFEEHSSYAGETPAQRVIISEENLKLACEVCHISSVNFSLLKKASVPTNVAAKTDTKSAVVDITEDNDTKVEFLTKNCQVVAALFKSPKNENNQTSVRVMMKGPKLHPVGKGHNSKQEYIKFINLLENMGVVEYKEENRGTLVHQKIKILTAQERNEDANELVDTIEEAFLVKNPENISPFN